jgi:TPR repeat protein
MSGLRGQVPANRRCKAWLALCACCLAMPWAAAEPVQDNQAAEMEFSRGDLGAAISLWKRAAQAGFAPAQARLGDILDSAEENADAVAWYRLAAEQGNAAGEAGLGQMYAKGEGVAQDLAQARLYISRAAQQGHVLAMRTLVEAYRSGGLGFEVDAAQADAWEAKVAARLAAEEKAARKPAGTTQSGQSGDSK